MLFFCCNNSCIENDVHTEFREKVVFLSFYVNGKIIYGKKSGRHHYVGMFKKSG